MTLIADFEECQAQPTSDSRHAIVNAAQGQKRRLLWSFATIVSILSARHLLVEQNVHFPLQLYFCQVAATAVIALWINRTRKDSLKHFRSRLQLPTTWRAAMVPLIMCFTSLSTICALEAVLHFQNLPTMLMLISIAFFVESMLLCSNRMVQNTRIEMLRIALLGLASGGIMLSEYRINVRNAAATIPAMILAGSARALWKAVVRHFPESVADSTHQSGRFVLISALVGAIWGMSFWARAPMLSYVELKSVPFLVINAVASAFAFLLGKSWLLPMDEDVADLVTQTADASMRQIWDTLTLATVTGVVGCYSTFATRRSYNNAYQYVCFFVALLCISGKSWIDGSGVQQQRSRGAYELVGGASSPSAEDHDHDHDHDTHFEQNGDNASKSSPMSGMARNNRLHTMLFGIGLGLVWVMFGGLNFTERPNSPSSVTLDRAYVPETAVEIVISMYKESVEEVANVIHNLKSIPGLSDAQSTIYIKDSDANNEEIQEATGVNRIITIPNVGREGETYLNHILRRWDSLARQTVFLQADIHNKREFYKRVKNYYSESETGFLNLGWAGGVCSCDHCGDHLFFQDTTNFLPELHNRINNATECKNILLSYKGQFIVSAARIRGIGQDIYKDLWDAFVDENSWAHQQEYLNGRPDSMNAPEFGYMMERTWNLLFQCSDSDVSWKCPTLISGWRIGGDIGDCQCFDN